ncbi:MAG TPA: MFS transporter [Acidobacteriota bacterium]|nr:MFS transporter [Acidobacteriota bacterium]
MKSKLFIVTVLAYLAFISIGLPDGLLGVAWPSIRTFYHLPIEALGTLLLLFTFGYLISSFYNGWLLARMNIGMLLVLSCLATGVSLIGFTIAPNWWMFVLFANIAGLGAGAIDAGLNTYAAKNFSPRTINWLHAAYGVGTSTGPYIMTALLVRNFPWQSGYAIVGTSQLVLATLFLVTLKQWKNEQHSAAQAAKREIPLMKTLRLPQVWLSIALFFLYTGLEASLGLWSYTLLTEARRIDIATAGMWVSVYWITFTAGRLLSGFIANRVQPNSFLRVSIIGVIIGAALLWQNGSHETSFIGLAMMGLFCAPIFPTLIATTPTRLGVANAANAIGFQIAAATISWSAIPALLGLLAGNMGLSFLAPAFFLLTVLVMVFHEAFLLTLRLPRKIDVLTA